MDVINASRLTTIITSTLLPVFEKLDSITHKYAILKRNYNVTLYTDSPVFHKLTNIIVQNSVCIPFTDTGINLVPFISKIIENPAANCLGIVSFRFIKDYIYLRNHTVFLLYYPNKDVVLLDSHYPYKRIRESMFTQIEYNITRGLLTSGFKYRGVQPIYGDYVNNELQVMPPLLAQEEIIHRIESEMPILNIDKLGIDSYFMGLIMLDFMVRKTPISSMSDTRNPDVLLDIVNTYIDSVYQSYLETMNQQPPKITLSKEVTHK